MKVRLGFVAMSLHLKDCSPSKTITKTVFDKIESDKHALLKVQNLVEQNAKNTLRILRHCVASGVFVYRFTSKTIPLAGILLKKYPFDALLSNSARMYLQECGDVVTEHNMRVSAHPDHFTLLSSANQNVLNESLIDLEYHNLILNAMGLHHPRYKLVLHIGSTEGGKDAAIERFTKSFCALPYDIKNRIILENDDKSYTAAETLKLCCDLNIPMVFDLHHHNCNGGGDISTLLPNIFATWDDEPFPPKVHFSSPKSQKEFRAHADHIVAAAFANFLKTAKKVWGRDLDVMLEAKAKDEALFELSRQLKQDHKLGISVMP